MIERFLTQQIISQLPFVPTEEQNSLIVQLGQFLASHDPDKCFILRGYAGTGKTTVISALVKAMQTLNQTTILLAPTGRAAKVIAAYSGHAAYTIHKKIYRQHSLGEMRFGLNDNLYKNALFIVDEASMISNLPTENSIFGTGRLLDDLITYVYSGDHCSLLLLGDDAQLPPVGQPNSPALERTKLESYGLHVSEFQLTQVVRQALESGILHNATTLRNRLSVNDVNKRPNIELSQFTDIHKLEGQEVLESLEKSYAMVGSEETIVLTRTNRRTNLYNQGIRSRILWKDDEISNGDRLMVVKNNYFWTKDYEGIEFLANGDMFEIKRIRNFREMYGYRFADASLKSVDYDWEIDTIIWLDTLFTDSPDNNYEMQRTLFERVAEDYPEIRNHRELVKAVYENNYYNALQVRFAYSVTCHKAQGGQWQHVYIDQGTLQDEQINTDYYRWLYTALTRATKQIYLINV